MDIYTNRDTDRNLDLNIFYKDFGPSWTKALGKRTYETHIEDKICLHISTEAFQH